MGNIESGEFGNFWDNPGTAEGYGGSSYYRDDESHRDHYTRDEEEEERRRSTAPTSPVVIKGKEEPVTAAPPAEPIVVDPPVVVAEEITSSEAVAAQDQAAEAISTTTHDVNISKSQTTNQLPPVATTKSASGGTTERVQALRVGLRVRDVPFALLFVAHVLLVTAAIVFLNIVYLKDMSRRKLHNLERWFPQLGAAVVTGSFFAFVCQTLFRVYPMLMARSIVWASSLLTFGVALLLISTSIPASLGVGVLCLIFSICQSLYACWISHRIRYAGELLISSLSTANKIPGTYLVSFWVLLVASVWLIFWSFGVVSALSFQLAPLVVLALLASLAWTLETLRNVVCTATARGVAALYLTSEGEPRVRWDQSLHAAFTTCFGSICLGSLIVPTLHFLRVVARGLNRIHGDNEFMFSCADCFYKVTNGFAKYANNWAYVQVAVHGKTFVKASKDTFSLFSSKRLDLVINTDLTSSFCVLSGITGGMLCVLVSGGWTFGTHKALTSSVSVVAFFIGYFLVRIMMAVPQGAVCAHYVCYGENPASQEWRNSPVPDRLKELLAEVDTETAKRV